MIENINKNISVWRGDTTPPTDYHLWETSDGIIKTKINGEWKQLTSPTDKENVDKSIYEISTALHDENKIHYLLKHNNAPDSSFNLEAVTTSKSGLMTSSDKIKLDTNIHNLGYFNTSGDAEQAASQPKISGNNEIALIQYRYGLKSGLIIQQVGDFRTLQILLLDGGNSARWINFTDSTRTKVRAISRWNKCGITSLGYDKDNHKLNVRFLDDTLPDAGVKLPIIEEKDNKWGLIDRTTYDNAVNLYNKLNNLILKSVDPTSSTVLQSYQLVDGNDNVLGDTINIPKDSSIKTVEIADTEATIDNDGNIIKGSGDTALSIVYILSDGTYKIVNLSLQDFLEESEFGNGLNVENHKVSIKKSDSSEKYLIINENSISVEGVNGELNKKVDKITGKGLSTNDFTNNYKTNLDTLSESIKNLGYFNTEAEAINYLKTLPICADTKIIHAHLTYGDENNPSTITMIQNIKDSWCRQILFRDDKVQQRAIYFTNSERTEIRGVEDLQYLFGDRLKWDNNAHKYLLSQYGDTWNEQYTDPIPIVSTTTNGLMSKEDKVNLDDVSIYNYIGTLNSWNKIAKLTTKSTESDILSTLIITPIRGNAPTTKEELFTILDKCALQKKFLRESSTNAHVFVNHIGSCYVIYILGNKASVLNGKLVGTLILRSITITANSNETLAVLKNPFEINLEDINKKITEIENNINNLSIKAE